jgi:hypothetical protein
MTARTRKWVVLSVLCLMSLDLALVAVAAPRARGWLESARTSALVRAGTSALRNLEGPGARGVANLSASLVSRFTRRSTSVYAFVLRATPRGVAGEAARQARPEARWVIVETRCDRALAVDCRSSCATPNCPSSSCSSSNCPKHTAAQGTSSGSPTTALPISMLGMTLE